MYLSGTESKYFDRSDFHPMTPSWLHTILDTSCTARPQLIPFRYDLQRSCTRYGVSSNSRSLAMDRNILSIGSLTYTVRKSPLSFGILAVCGGHIL